MRNMEINKVYQMDCIEGLKKIPTGSIDLIILDPPYFKTINEKWDYKWKTELEYLEWTKKWVSEINRIAKDTSSIYLFGYFRILCYMIPIIIENGFELRQQIIIDKGMKSVCGRKTSTYKMFPTTTESILFFVKNNKNNIKKILKERQKKLNISAKEINERLGAKSNGGGLWSLYTGENISAQIPTKEKWEKLQEILQFKKNYSEISYIFNQQMGYTDVWRDIDFYKEKRFHPTQKPIKLIERLIKASSCEGMLVLDPFMGSGNIIITAKKLKRNYIGFEIEKKYYDITCNRLHSIFKDI